MAKRFIIVQDGDRYNLVDLQIPALTFGKFSVQDDKAQVIATFSHYSWATTVCDLMDGLAGKTA